MERHHNEELKNLNYEVFILAISFLSILNWSLYFILDDGEVLGVIFFVDLLLAFIFLGDFLYRLFTAESKRRYFLRQYGWLDLISSLPFPQIRITRLGRIIRAIIMMREIGVRTLVKRSFEDRVGTAVYLVAILIIVVLEFGSLLVLAVEQGAPGSNIKTAGDAVWWSIVTMATVGYGDFTPVTGQGRFLAVFVIVLGVALFGVVTGSLANRFVVPAEETKTLVKLDQEAENLGHLIKEVKNLQIQNDRSFSEIEAQIKSLRVLLEDRHGSS